jgi:very-short-patch-repair endonuclease
MKRGGRELDSEARAPAVRKARAFRRALSPPEARLWMALRRRSVVGWRFRRQAPVGPYVLDFYCPEAALAVEVDGEWHGFADQPQRDERRDAWLAERGVRTLRIPAVEVRDNLDGVVTDILEACRK